MSIYESERKRILLLWQESKRSPINIHILRKDKGSFSCQSLRDHFKMHRAVVLYRAILKVHRIKLPVTLRVLGNEYVKNEFKLHKNVKNSALLDKFYNGWEDYLRMMIRQELDTIGKDMTEDELAQLSDEQREKLTTLKEDNSKKSAK